MLFIYKKAKLRLGAEGKIARWIGETYVQLKHQHPATSERELRLMIGAARYPNGELDLSTRRGLEHLSLGNAISESDCLLDIVVAIIRNEIGTDYQDNPKQMRLMYAVIFEELIEYDIPRNIAMTGQ